MTAASWCPSFPRSPEPRQGPAPCVASWRRGQLAVLLRGYRAPSACPGPGVYGVGALCSASTHR